MRVPDITKIINGIQRSNTIDKEDKGIVCSAVQHYWNYLASIGATKKGINVQYTDNTDNILNKYLDKMTRDDLIEIAVNKNISIDEDDTRAIIMSKIKGE
jgi:hypothetical protein